MKKFQFKGIDLAVVEKFKAPIKKFNTNNDLQNWTKAKIDNITHKQFTARTFHSVVYRNGIIQEAMRDVYNPHTHTGNQGSPTSKPNKTM